jgi:hypothetical protein
MPMLRVPTAALFERIDRTKTEAHAYLYFSDRSSI